MNGGVHSGRDAVIMEEMSRRSPVQSLRARTADLAPPPVLLVPAALLLVLMLVVSGCDGTSRARAGGATSDAGTDTAVSTAPPGDRGSVTASSVTASSISPVSVGVTHRTLIDPTRSTGARGDHGPTESRSLPLTIRYPIRSEDSAAAVTDPASAEVEDAPPAGQWPLIVFAHGLDASAATYAGLLHELAAAGFVVIAPEFPLSSNTVDAPAIEGDEPEQARDMRFIIETFTHPSDGDPIAGAIDPGPVGVMGHSDGAQTALLVGFAPAYRDDRIGAVVAVSGRYSTFGGRWFAPVRPALLVVQATDDELNPFRYGEELVRLDSGPASLVAVDGVTHLGAVTDARAIGPVGALVADMFAWRLRSVTAARDRIPADSLVAPLRPVASHG